MRTLLRTERIAVPLFFLLLAALGLLILPDYGIGWDEDAQRVKGEIAYDYVHDYFGWEHTPLRPEQPLATYEQNFYNTLFPLIAVAITQAMDVPFTREWYRPTSLAFHYLVFAVAFVGFYAFYRLLRARLADWRWALLGLSFLLLSPRVSFHSFFNTKDTILQAGVTVATATFAYLLGRISPGRALLHGLACGLAVAIRPVGVLVVALTVAFLLVEIWRKPPAWRTILPALALYLGTTAAVTVAGWPFLWEDPLGNFVVAWQSFANFPWDGQALLFNVQHHTTDLPWYYLPGWMAVTIPPLLLLCLAYGSYDLGRRWVTSLRRGQWYQDAALRTDLFQAGLLAGALGAIMLLGSVLYDTWRHVYFVYPALVYLATVGLRSWWRRPGGWRLRYGKPITRVAIGGSLVYLLGWCVWMHPYQFNYFNLLAGDHLELRYEVDYWGVGFQPAIREVLRRDPRDTIHLLFSNYSGHANTRILPARLRERVRIVYDERGRYDYFISNFRFPGERERYKNGSGPYAQPHFSIDYPYGRGKMYEVYRGNTDFWRTFPEAPR